MGQTDRQTGRQLSRPLGPSAQLFQSPKSPPPMGPDTVTGEREGGEEAEEAEGRRPPATPAQAPWPAPWGAHVRFPSSRWAECTSNPLLCLLSPESAKDVWGARCLLSLLGSRTRLPGEWTHRARWERRRPCWTASPWSVRTTVAWSTWTLLCVCARHPRDRLALCNTPRCLCFTQRVCERRVLLE